MAKRKPEIPPPKRGRGRPPKYVVGRDGKEIVGLSHRKSDGRYYATRAEPTVYFCTDFDAASALPGRSSNTSTAPRTGVDDELVDLEFTLGHVWLESCESHCPSPPHAVDSDSPTDPLS